MIHISHQHQQGDARSKPLTNKGRQQFIETHGGSYSKLYRTWIRMRARCYNPTQLGKQWDDYGGRGIRVCKAWLNNFAAFRDWALANGYRDDLTIERKNNNGNYEPRNCCWIPLKDQAKNRRKRKWLKRP